MTKKPDYASHNQPSKKITATIVGARGYSGLELARLLLAHPFIDLLAVAASEADWRLADYLPERAAEGVPVKKIPELPQSEIVFLATPHEVSMELAPQFLARGCHVVDLSGAFRLDQASFEEWYGLPHTCPEMIKEAIYGLVPWRRPAELSKAQLVANPGCFASATLMALLPLLQHKIIDPKTIVIDAKSGTSGAGRKALEHLLFTEVEGECRPYRLGRHQHLPEIQAAAQKFTGVQIDPFFSTHLLNVRRGITVGIYARTGDSSLSSNSVASAYQEAYASYPLVEWGAADLKPALLSLKRVVGSARTQISWAVEGNKIYVFSAIDNLLKGAASQAVENCNQLMDWPVTTGLTNKEGLL